MLCKLCYVYHVNNALFFETQKQDMVPNEFALTTFGKSDKSTLTARKARFFDDFPVSFVQPVEAVFSDFVKESSFGQEIYVHLPPRRLLFPFPRSFPCSM